MRTQLRVRRECGAHFAAMASFWQEQEVSVPNKPVVVPRSLLLANKGDIKLVTKISLEKAIELKHFEST